MNDPYAIVHFLQNGDVVLHPIVLEELDALKGRKQEAQDAIRVLEQLLYSTDEDPLNGGMTIVFREEKLLGKLALQSPKYDRVLKSKKFLGEVKDNQILNLAYTLSRSRERVKLVTEDLNVLSKARAVGVTAEKVKYLTADEQVLQYSGYRTVPEEYLSSFAGKNFSDPELVQALGARVNEFFLLPGEESFFYRFNGEEFLFRLRPNDKKKNGRYLFGIKPKNLEQAMALDILLDPSISVITLQGVAGTGKTLLALVAALSAKHKGEVSEILVSRRELGVQGEEHGFLPGSEKDKIRPYIMPFIDNIKVIGKADTRKLLPDLRGEGEFPFEYFSLIYLRGRSLNEVYLLIDEAQNLTPHQAKTIVTRAGMGTKIIFLGDIDQADINAGGRYLRRNMNGIVYLKKNFLKFAIPLYAHLTLKEVTRSEVAKLGALLP